MEVIVPLALLALALQAATGLGLLIAAFVMAAAHGWRAAMENRTDRRWSVARRLMFAGAGLLLVALTEAALLTLWASSVDWMTPH